MRREIVICAVLLIAVVGNSVLVKSLSFINSLKYSFENCLQPCYTKLTNFIDGSDKLVDSIPYLWDMVWGCTYNCYDKGKDMIDEIEEKEKLEVRLLGIESRITGVESRITGIESRITAQLSAINQKLGIVQIETEGNGQTNKQSNVKVIHFASSGYPCDTPDTPCGKFGESYFWCHYTYQGKSGYWDYCSPNINQTTDGDFCTPESPCQRSGPTDRYWCYIDEKRNWRRCSPVEFLVQ